MKRIIHIMTCAIVCALLWDMNVYAQDKVYFVPDPETARWSYLEMDGNGATTATMVYSVNSMTGDAVNGSAKVKFESAGKQSSEEAAANFIYYKFKDGEFMIDMTAFFEADVLGELIDAAAGAEGIGASEEEKKKAIEEVKKLIEVSGEVRGIPRYPVIGALPDYEFVFKFSFVSMSVKGTERKISGKEKLTTPAGTFDCFIMEETVTTKAMMQKEVEKTVSWYAYGVGLVKENTYDKKGKLVSTTLLNSINW